MLAFDRHHGAGHVGAHRILSVAAGMVLGEKVIDVFITDLEGAIAAMRRTWMRSPSQVRGTPA
jgi:hypothetical protein